MANISDIVGALMQTGMSSSTNKRIKNTFGAEGPGSQSAPSGMLGGLGDALSGLLGGGGGIGNVLSDVLNDAGRAVGGEKNLKLGGLGALAGAILGGGGGSMKGALGGGAMALLASMAFSAFKKAGQKPAEVPLGLRRPETLQQEKQLEDDAELVLKAMLNAAKADGQIDEKEIQRIFGQLKESGVDRKSRDYVIAEMRKPMDLTGIVAAAKNRPDLGAQLYAASLLAIEVDTPGEKKYMQALANGLGLNPQVVSVLEKTVGIA